jgi:hypothetical protein
MSYNGLHSCIWVESEIELRTLKGTFNKFVIVHNLNKDGYIDSIHSALDNWLVRTEEYTQQAFIDYINEKGVYKAMTVEQFQALRNQV